MNEWGNWQGRMRMDTDTILVMLERAGVLGGRVGCVEVKNDTALALRKPTSLTYFSDSYDLTSDLTAG